MNAPPRRPPVTAASTPDSAMKTAGVSAASIVASGTSAALAPSNGSANGLSSSTPQRTQPEPYALEAKTFSEVRRSVDGGGGGGWGAFL